MLHGGRSGARWSRGRDRHAQPRGDAARQARGGGRWVDEATPREPPLGRPCPIRRGALQLVQREVEDDPQSARPHLPDGPRWRVDLQLGGVVVADHPDQPSAYVLRLTQMARATALPSLTTALALALRLTLTLALALTLTLTLTLASPSPPPHPHPHPHLTLTLTSPSPSPRRELPLRVARYVPDLYESPAPMQLPMGAGSMPGPSTYLRVARRPRRRAGRPSPTPPSPPPPRTPAARGRPRARRRLLRCRRRPACRPHLALTPPGTVASRGRLPGFAPAVATMRRWVGGARARLDGRAHHRAAASSRCRSARR